MTTIKGTTRAQTIFLRSFRNPTGPAPSDWPSPAILRRWLRSPHFCRALESIQQTHRFQTDFLLSTAASQAAAALTQPASDSSNPDLCPLTSALSILRLYHLRQRFAADHGPDPHDFNLDPTTGLKILRFLRTCDRNLKLADVWNLLFTVDHRIETFWTDQEYLADDEEPRLLAPEQPADL